MTIEKRLERLEAILDARGLDWDHPRVAEEPAKEASLGGLPDLRTFAQPNLRWRILRPDEIVQDGDWMNARVNSQEVGPPDGGWLAAPSFYFGKEASVSFGLYFARPVTEKPRLGSGEAYRLLSKEQLEDFIPFGDFGMGTGLCGTSSIDEPAKEAEPAWEPKIGDWVRVTRPVDWIEWEHPRWGGAMHEFDGRVGQIERESEGHFYIRGFAAWNGFRYQFHRDWLSPAEPPEPEYREPVLPADAGKWAEFNDGGTIWERLQLRGWVFVGDPSNSKWISNGGACWTCCRIKKDA